MKPIYILAVCLLFGTIEVDSIDLITELINLKDYEKPIIEFVRWISRGISGGCLAYLDQRQRFYKSWVRVDKLSMYMYSRAKFRRFKMSTAADKIWNSTDFHRRSPTVLFLHGYTANPNQEAAQLFARSIQLKHDANFLSFDMREYISRDIIRSTGTVPYLGIILSEFVLSLHKKGLPMNKLYIIAYSLGSQVAGLVGKTVKAKTNEKIFRITALDPFMWCINPLNRPLTSDDATYVDALHTTVVSIAESPIGHADFYANNFIGAQPGCGMNMKCSHRRSIYLFFESILNGSGFPAARCENTVNSSQICDRNHTSYMGFKSPINSRGIFIFKTNNDFPFAMGSKGLE